MEATVPARSRASATTPSSRPEPIATRMSRPPVPAVFTLPVRTLALRTCVRGGACLRLRAAAAGSGATRPTAEAAGGDGPTRTCAGEHGSTGSSSGSNGASGGRRPVRASRTTGARLGLAARLGRDHQRVVGLEVPGLALDVDRRRPARSAAHRRPGGRRRAWRARRSPPGPPSRSPPRARSAGRPVAPRRCCGRARPGPGRSARRSSAAARGGRPRHGARHLADGVARRLRADDAHPARVVARRVPRRRPRCRGSPTPPRPLSTILVESSVPS